MKFFHTIMGGVFVAATGVFAQEAIVVNNCGIIAYAQSFPRDGSAPGFLSIVGPGDTWTEDFRPSGSIVKIADNKYLTNPLSFSYSFSPNQDETYYEFSAGLSSFFERFHNILSPGEGCQAIDCQAASADCYHNTPDHRVYICPQPLNLTATLCV